MAFGLEDVARLAVLTRLEVGSEERERLREQLGAILEYVDRLAQIDTAGIPEVDGGREVFVGRPDALEMRDERTREIILENFPDALGGALRVPAVFDKPKG